jgi:hypothetical protein
MIEHGISLYVLRVRQADAQGGWEGGRESEGERGRANLAGRGEVGEGHFATEVE